MKRYRIPMEMWLPGLYALLGALWILFSDAILFSLVSDPNRLTRIQTAKGWAFVGASTMLIYWLLRRGLALQKLSESRLQASEEKYRALVEQAPYAVFVNHQDQIILANQACQRLFGAQREEDLIGISPFELFHPDYHALIRERIQQVQTLEQAVPPLEEKIVRLDGQLVDVEVVVMPFLINGDRAIHVMLQDITERKRAKEALQQRYRELQAIYEVSQRLHTLVSTTELAQRVVEALANTLNYAYGSVLLLDETTGELKPFAACYRHVEAEFSEAEEEFLPTEKLRLGMGITGWVAAHGQSVRLDDVREDPRYMPLREEIRAELCVPLRFRERVIGVINVEARETGAYSEDDQRLLETVAAQIAVAIQNARLLDEIRLQRDRLAKLSRQLVQAHETESRALGRELHDQFGQMLTALKLMLELMPQLPPEQAQKRQAQAEEIVQDLLNRVSRLSLELRPPMLDDLGLLPALISLINRYQEQTGLEVAFEHSGVEGVRFNAEIETTAYRLVQEALTNIARHAHAARVWLVVRAREGKLQIEISDDGQGFDPKAALARHRGLSGMRERAALVGGTFRVESAPGRGTKKQIELPLEEIAP